MSRLFVPALVAAVLTSSGLEAAETVADRVFGAGALAGVTQPTRLHYSYEMSGQGIDPPLASHVELDVREIAADGAKAVYIDMFEGQDRRQFGPIASREQNPLVLVFLQRDVMQMASLTGGAAMYFQQQIRRAFANEAESEPVEVALGDRKVPGRRLVMRPFANDPHIDRFPQFRDKVYEFVVAEDVPGGVYLLGSRTPDPNDGHLVLSETVTFAGAEP